MMHVSAGRWDKGRSGARRTASRLETQEKGRRRLTVELEASFCVGLRPELEGAYRPWLLHGHLQVEDADPVWAFVIREGSREQRTPGRPLAYRLDVWSACRVCTGHLGQLVRAGGVGVIVGLVVDVDRVPVGRDDVAGFVTAYSDERRSRQRRRQLKVGVVPAVSVE